MPALPSQQAELDFTSQDFSKRVLAWYHQHGRKHLPWQQNHDPYRIWVSEIMLQQTQVTTVIPYFQRFTDSFPTVEALANADEDAVLEHWAGLGYYARARNLQRAAKQVMTEFNGEFPSNIDELMRLSGVGRSTAGAILSLSLNQRHAILDGNVKRVLCRYFTISGHPSMAKVEKQLWQIAEKLTPTQENREYTQAMMDLGAMICARSSPQCQDCPIHVDCQAYAAGTMTNYPEKKQKKGDKPTRHFTMPLFVDGQTLYLEKRPVKGIWGGLWSLPLLETTTEIDDYRQKLTSAIGAEKTLAEFAHEFTHYKLRITPLWIDCKLTQNGVAFTDISTLGLPAAVKKILQRADIAILC